MTVAPSPRRGPLVALTTASALLVSSAHAEDRPGVEAASTRGPSFTPYGYVEAHFSYNANRPSNGITAYRGFDDRHATFTLQNVVLGTSWLAGPVGGRLALQVGNMPGAYYGSEPVRAGGGGTAATGPEVWRYLQEAFLTYEAPMGRGLLLQLGLTATPIGLERFAVKDNWNWSHSNLFFGLPYYHTGLRASYELADGLTLTASVFNGWNSVVDNNEEKSVQGDLVYRGERGLELQALYFGGIERATGSPEGPWWRHHFDGYAKIDATTFLSLAAQGDFGFEPSRFGTARWWATALFVRLKPVERIYVAVRGDRFHEHLATGIRGASSPIFWGGSEWVTSGTVTLDARPHDRVSIRLEGRHDVSEAPLYFARDVRGDGSAALPFVPNARTQTTILLGASAWF